MSLVWELYCDEVESLCSSEVHTEVSEVRHPEQGSGLNYPKYNNYLFSLLFYLD